MPTLLMFLNQRFVAIDGRHVLFDDFCREYHTWLFEQRVNPVEWPEKRIRAELEAEGFLVGQGPTGIIVGNLASPEGRKRWVKHPGDKYRLKLAPVSA